MRLQVDAEGYLSLEGLAALLTAKRPFAAVHEHVAIELRSAAEASLLAHLAMMRLLLAVTPFVRNQVA